MENNDSLELRRQFEVCVCVCRDSTERERSVCAANTIIENITPLFCCCKKEKKSARDMQHTLNNRATHGKRQWLHTIDQHTRKRTTKESQELVKLDAFALIPTCVKIKNQVP